MFVNYSQHFVNYSQNFVKCLSIIRNFCQKTPISSKNFHFCPNQEKISSFTYLKTRFFLLFAYLSFQWLLWLAGLIMIPKYLLHSYNKL